MLQVDFFFLSVFLSFFPAFDLSGAPTFSQIVPSNSRHQISSRQNSNRLGTLPEFSQPVFHPSSL